MTRVKICGITQVEDARDAVLLGASAIGLNFFDQSPRYVDPDRALEIIESLPPFVTVVGVFVDHPSPQSVEDFAMSLGLNAVQLHGKETPDYCSMIQSVKVIKAFRVDSAFRVEMLRNCPAEAFLLDAYSPIEFGGTGKTFNWNQVAGADAFGPIILAGGLTPENVREAVEQLHPFAVDVSSGVESTPGKKDYEKMRRFIEAVQKTDLAWRS